VDRNNKPTIEEIQKTLEDTWERLEPKTLNVWTGVGGYVLYLEAIEMEYAKYCNKPVIPWTEEKKEQVKKELIERGQTIFKL
jgi:hypothetical protein